MALLMLNGTPYGSANFENKIKYSTEEQVIGTWIDGKPLYQKTFINVSLPNASSTINHGIANIDNIFIDYTASYMHQTSYEGYRYPITFYAHQSGGYPITVAVNETNFIMYGSNGWDNWNFDITVKYTKTTDGGNS